VVIGTAFERDFDFFDSAKQQLMKINNGFLNAYKDVSLIHIIFRVHVSFVVQSENILVYPTGLIATVITVYLLFL
jgi:hypothetical protein